MRNKQKKRPYSFKEWILGSPQLEFDVLSQPDDSTCGPTCLHSVYRYYGDSIDLHQVIQEVHQFEEGGTLAVWLGCHALQRGYDALIYTCNLQVFDPTWFFMNDAQLLSDKLKEQMQCKKDKKLLKASKAYLDYLELGGKLLMEDLTRDLIRKYLNQGIPLLTGLSSTFLYRTSREKGTELILDDIQGEPSGHFVVLCGYNRRFRYVTIADPFEQNPFSPTRKYEIPIDRVICSILLGILTYDANFLIIRPPQ